MLKLTAFNVKRPGHVLCLTWFIVAVKFVDIQDQLVHWALLAHQDLLVVLDLQASLVQQDLLAALETLETLVSRVMLVRQVTPAKLVSLDGQELLDHKVRVVHQVQMER